MQFLLEIITPQRLAYSEQIDSVTVPTSRGLIGVMAHHEPLFSALTDGEIKVIKNDKETYIAIGGGFMEVTHEKVSILVSRAMHAHELNEAEIKKAQTAAKEIIAKKVKGEEREAAQMILRRSLMELKVLRRRRSSSSI